MGTSAVINTEKLGKLSWTRYNKLVKKAGSQVSVAKEFGVSPSTVRNWGLRLRTKRSEVTAG